MIPIHKPEELNQNKTESTPQINPLETQTELIPDGYSILDKLPSKFLPYPTNKIYVKPFTLGDLEQLADMKRFDLLKFLSIIKDIVNPIPVTELAVLDLKVILIYSLILSEDNKGWNLPCICNHCGTDYTHNLKIEQLNFNDISISQLPIKETIKEQEVEFDVLRMKHLVAINDFLATKTNTQSFSTKLLSLAFVSNIKNKEQAYNLLSQLPISYKDKIEYIADNIIQSISPITTECPNKHLSIIIEDQKQQELLLNNFKSINNLNGTLYLPTDTEVKASIFRFIQDNNITYQSQRCSHKQERKVELDFSNLYP